MSSIFSSSLPIGAVTREGIVVTVDPIRFSATVRLNSGAILLETTWLLPTGGSQVEGFSHCPNIGDKVLVSLSSSEPIILGSIPRQGFSTDAGAGIANSTSGVDSGNNTNLRNGSVLNPTKPGDFLQGDRVMGSRGGFIAVLGSGGVLARASHMSQLFLSKYEGLARLVGRNFQRFSDASSEVSANVKGRMYHWFGADKSMARSSTNTERYNEAYGDVVAAEILKGNPNPNSSVSPSDSRIRKHWLTDSIGSTVMVETLYEDGHVVLNVTSPNQAKKSTETVTNELIEHKVEDGSISKITLTPSSIVIDFNGESIGTFDTAGIRMESKGHFMRIDETGTHLG